MGDNRGLRNQGTEANNRVTGILFLLQGDDVPEEIQLSGTTKTFGRAVNNDVVCNCLQISRKHATFKYTNNKWFLIDMSTNGLCINGRKIDKGVASELSHNDLILFIPTGTLEYKFQYVNRDVLPNMSNATSMAPTNSLPSSESIPETIHDWVSATIPKPIVRIDDSESNHSESLLDAGEAIQFRINANENVRSIIGDDHGSSAKGSQHCIKVNNKETRAKRPHTTDEPNSLSAKRKLLKKESKSNDVDEEEQELPDIEELEDSMEDVIDLQELPDIDYPYDNSITVPKQKPPQLTSDNIMKCNDITTLRKYCLDFKCKLENQEAAGHLQIIEKSIEYEKLLDKYNESESKAEVHKEEVFKLIMDAMEREFGCCVCNEVFIDASVIECGHTFCNFCIGEWQRRNPECPICRAHIRKQTKHKEMENFIVTIHGLMSEEIRSKREIAIQERAKAIEKAEVDRVASARGRRGAIADLADHNIIEFLTDIHMHRMFGVRAHRGIARRGSGRGTSTSRRSTRLQNQASEVATGAAAGTRSRGRGRRQITRRTPSATATAPNANSTASNAVGATVTLNFPVPHVPLVNNATAAEDPQPQPGPSRFMGLLGLVNRAAASTGRVGFNLFTSNPTPTSSTSAASSVPGGLPDMPTLGERLAPRVSDSIVMLSSDDDMDLVGETRGNRRTGRTRVNPISIDFFSNADYDSSGSSDDEY